MTATKTRRQKVAAMAEQSASPAEAEVAKAMLATMADDRPRLEVLADDVRTEWGKGIDAQFAVGKSLSEAYSILNNDKVAFGRWVAEQAFPFDQSTGYLLRIGYEREPEVRGFIANHGLVHERELSVTTATKRLIAGPKKSHTELTGEVEPVTDTTPVDPAYAALRTAHRLIVEEGGFVNMHVEDLVKCAGFIKDLAAEYTVAKSTRSA